MAYRIKKSAKELLKAIKDNTMSAKIDGESYAVVPVQYIADELEDLRQETK